MSIDNEFETDFVTLLVNIPENEEAYFEGLNNQGYYDTLQLEDGSEIDGLENIDDFNKAEGDLVRKSAHLHAMYDSIDSFIRAKFIPLFNVRVVDDHNIDGIYVKFCRKIINIDNINKLNGSECDKYGLFEPSQEDFPIYFILNKKIKINDVHLIKLSRAFDFAILREMNGEIVYQGFSDGDYEDGYFSEDCNPEYICSNNNAWSNMYMKYVFRKNDIKDELLITE